MSKNTFLMHNCFEKPLSKKAFEEAKSAYLTLIEKNNYSMKATTSIYELIKNVKRSPATIGPYKDISVFEALNRIGSDLVLLEGAEKLFNGEIESIKPKSIELRMGNKHGFDFTVTLDDDSEILGEAFNAAESFCKHKYRQAIDKFANEKLDEWTKILKSKKGILFINQEVEATIKQYKNKKEGELEKKDITIYKVYCDLTPPSV
jgi:hypothetical protein